MFLAGLVWSFWILASLFRLPSPTVWFVLCSAGLVTFYPFNYRECALGQTLSQRLGKKRERKKNFLGELSHITWSSKPYNTWWASVHLRAGGRDSFCLGSREPRKVSRALMFDVGLRNKKKFFSKPWNRWWQSLQPFLGVPAKIKVRTSRGKGKSRGQN